MKSLESAAGAAPKAGMVLGILTIVIMGLAAAFNLAARGVAMIIQSMSGVGLEKLKVFGATVVKVMMALNQLDKSFSVLRWLFAPSETQLKKPQVRRRSWRRQLGK